MAFDPVSIAIQLAISTILSFALAPKPEKVDPANLEDLDFPVAQEGGPLGVVFGRVWVKSQNTLWAGDFKVTPIKGPRKYLLFGPRITIGYEYRLGLDMSVSHGAIDAYYKFKYGTNTYPLQIGANAINKDEIKAEILAYPGTETQTANTYLVDKIKEADWPLTFEARNSALRGLAHVVFMGIDLGKSPYLRKMEFELARIPERREVGLQTYFDDWAEEEGEIVGVSPAAIIHELLTNTVWGMAEPVENTDLESFQAAHEQLVSEEFWMNLFWARDSSVEEIISLVLSHIDGWLYIDRTTGKFVLRLNRKDFNEAEVPTFEDEDVISWGTLGRPSAEEAANTIVLTFKNRKDGAPSTITETNLAARQRQGRQTFESIQFPGISTENLAKAVARREIRKRSLPLLNGKIDVPFNSAVALQPGAPIYVSSERRGISPTLCRVESVELGSSSFGGKATLQILQDTSLAIDLDANADFDEPVNPFVVTLQPVQDNEAIELPLSPALWGLPGTATVETFDESSTTVAGAATFSPFTGADEALTIVSKLEGGDFFEELSPSPRGELVSDVPATPNNVTFTLENVSGDLSEIVGQLCLLGDEWVVVNSVSGSDVTAQRGFLDSVPLEHSAGTRLVQVIPGEIASYGTAPAQFRLLTEFKGEYLPEAQADLLSVPNTRRAARPYPVANLRVDGSLTPSLREGPVTLTWVNRDRNREAPFSLSGYLETTSKEEVGAENTLRIWGAASETGPFDTLLVQENLGQATSYGWDGAFTGWCKAEVEVVRNGLSNRHQFPIVWEQAAQEANFLPQDADALITSDGDLFLVEE